MNRGVQRWLTRTLIACGIAALGWVAATSCRRRSLGTHYIPLSRTSNRRRSRVPVGDLVRLRTPRGTLDYRVRETLIVDPDDLRVLEPTPTSMLTLISCYPFRYVGPAPQRFIVRADRMLAPAMTVASLGSSRRAQGEGYERR